MTDLADKPTTAPSNPDEWHKSVCILCSANCGVEIRIEDRRFTRVRGNKAHVASEGYTCEKALRLDHYQNNRSRLTSPMRRRDDGSYEPVDWDTAIAEVAERLTEVGRTHGQDKVMYYGGGGQGNHLCGAYGAATRKALGITRRSNALAQEKTGEAWVEGRMFGTHTHGHFADAEVSVFLGKNPWHSHGFDAARRVLKEIAADDDRTMIVIDPRRTETADLADHWLAVKPGTDAFLLAAIGGVIVEEGLAADAWLSENVVGHEETKAAFSGVPVADFADHCGVDEATIRTVARRLGSTRSVAFYEDLGIEMAPHSTLVSWLHRAIWTLVGSYGAHGGHSAHSSFVPLFSYGATGSEPTDPVTGGQIISGLIPCNEIAEGVLSDHPDRSRAMVIESANPVHSLAGSQAFREAMRALEFSVVIDVAMTETAREADYVLPASSQYEKAEVSFFAANFPENNITLRAPVVEALEGTLPEAEIHARLCRALGAYGDDEIEPLKAAAHEGRAAFTDAFMTAAMGNPTLGGVGAVVLYETLGSTLPEGLEAAAAMWFSAQQLAMKMPDQLRAAGHEGDGVELGWNLFDALVESRDGIIFSAHEHDDAFDLLKTPDQKIHIHIPELATELAGLADGPTHYTSEEFPIVLAAGERRSFTANTIMRDPDWRKRDAEGALRLSVGDAERHGIETGDRVRITTPGGSGVAVAEVNDTMMDGHMSLPNGMGLAYSPAGGEPEVVGVAPNELTSLDWRDPIAGTPWHKHVPARIERVAR